MRAAACRAASEVTERLRTRAFHAHTTVSLEFVAAATGETRLVSLLPDLRDDDQVLFDTKKDTILHSISEALHRDVPNPCDANNDDKHVSSGGDSDSVNVTHG